MLKKRVLTALALLAVLLPVFYWNSYEGLCAILALFFAGAIWETQRLFHKPFPLPMAVLWAAFLLYVLTHLGAFSQILLFAICLAFWLLRICPMLWKGAPTSSSVQQDLAAGLAATETVFDPRRRSGKSLNTTSVALEPIAKTQEIASRPGFATALMSGVYAFTLFGAFVAVATLFQRSPLFLFSGMALVWLADIGAYFSGKAWGRHKLAPRVSPGKTWEGALGGLGVVLCAAAVSLAIPVLSDTLPNKLLRAWGWGGMALMCAVLVALSITGDLFESLIKRMAGVKDSSQLLPGHGGVLDRIDALVPTMSAVALLDMFL